MKKQLSHGKETIRSFGAVFLAVVLLQAVLLKEAHYFFGSLHHDNSQKCFATGDETHLHTADYKASDCQLCVFHFSPAKVEFPEFSIRATLPALCKPVFSYANPLAAHVEWQLFLRGPPALSA